MEKTMTVELTETQYKHIQEVLAMNKPSKTRLTQQEKSIISMVCENFLEDHPYTDDCDLVRSIIKKMK